MEFKKTYQTLLQIKLKNGKTFYIPSTQKNEFLKTINEKRFIMLDGEIVNAWDSIAHCADINMPTMAYFCKKALRAEGVNEGEIGENYEKIQKAIIDFIKDFQREASEKEVKQIIKNILSESSKLLET